MPTDLDTYKPEKYANNALFRPDTKQAYKDLVAQGWTDAIRTLYPNERIYTFWDYLRDAYGRNAGLRLDHFLLNSKIAERLVNAGVDKHVRAWEKTSDHAPVWIELADEDGKAKPKIKPIAANLAKTDVATLLKAAPKKKMPASIKLMKATLVDEAFDDAGWIYEVKWDGYRAIAKVEKNHCELISRNNLPFDQFGPVDTELEKWQINAILDGEIAALNEKGNANFGALQNWRNMKDAKLVY